MNIMLRTFIGFSVLLFATYSWSSVVINGTRVIYPESAGFITVQLVNKSATTHLVQTWIDKGDPAMAPEQIQVPFSLTPPVVKMESGEGQALKLAKQDVSGLPKDRESVFWLNVLDVPPLPGAQAQENYLQVALRSRIKLFYRPVGLKASESDIDNGLSLITKNGGQCINNASPFHVTLVRITPWHGEPLKQTPAGNLLDGTAFIAPFSCFPLKRAAGHGKKYRISRLDDFGSQRNALIEG